MYLIFRVLLQLNKHYTPPSYTYRENEQEDDTSNTVVYQNCFKTNSLTTVDLTYMGTRAKCRLENY